MKVLFYDTETTGLPLWGSPSDDPGQPHIVQIGAALVDADNDCAAVDMLDTIVMPDGWTIPAVVAEIHGITTEHALANGLPEGEVVQKFDELWRRADLRVAHSEQFDARILRIAYFRFFGEARADEWKAGKAECTKVLASPHTKLPPTEKMLRAGFTKFKDPTLVEAYSHFSGGRVMQDAHSAIGDCRACFYVWRAIRRLKEAV